MRVDNDMLQLQSCISDACIYSVIDRYLHYVYGYWFKLITFAGCNTINICVKSLYDLTIRLLLRTCSIKVSETLNQQLDGF